MSTTGRQTLNVDVGDLYRAVIDFADHVTQRAVILAQGEVSDQEQAKADREGELASEAWTALQMAMGVRVARTSTSPPNGDA